MPSSSPVEPDEGSAANPAVGFARLSRESAVYSLGSVAGKAVGLMMVPILVRTLTKDAFGELDVLSALTSALICALPLGVDVASVRLYFDERDEAGRRVFVTTNLMLLLLFVVPPSLVLIATAPLLSRWLFGTTALGGAIVLVGAAVAAGTAQTAAQAVLRMQRRPGGFAAVETVSLVLNAAFAISFLYGWHKSVTVVMIAYAASNTLAAILGVWLIRRSLARHPSRPVARRIVTAALPLAPGLVATWGAEFAHRAILLASGGATEVAYFSIAVRFGSVGVLVASGYQLAWQPHTFSRDTTEANASRVRTEATRIATTVATGTCVVALVAPELVRLLAGRSYEPALGAVGFALVFAIALALFQIATVPLTMEHRFRDVGVATTVGVAAAISSNIALSPTFGAAGAAAAMTVGQGIAIATAWRRGHTQTSLRLPWARLLTTFSTATVIVLVADLPTGGASPLLRVLLGAGLLAKLAIDGSLAEITAFARKARARGSARR